MIRACELMVSYLMQLEGTGSDGEPNGVKVKEYMAEDTLRPLPPDDSLSKPITERSLGRLQCSYSICASLLPTCLYCWQSLCTCVYHASMLSEITPQLNGI